MALLFLLLTQSLQLGRDLSCYIKKQNNLEMESKTENRSSQESLVITSDPNERQECACNGP